MFQGQSEKPNPEMRDKLNAILLTPVTQILTSEEQDLIWKYRYYLADKKKVRDESRISYHH